MYAIIETGGKQYPVKEGDLLKVEKLDGEVDSTINIDKVLAIGGDSLKTGKPYLEGASVKATIKAQGKNPKIVVGKFKAKKGYHRKRGHRQPYTLIQIDQING